MTDHHAEKRRPIVGIMVGYILSEYSLDYNVRLVKELCKEVEKIGAVAKVYTTVEYDSSLEKISDGDESLAKHWIAGVSYCQFDNPCAMIVAYSTIVHDHTEHEIESFLEGLPDIPIIVIGNRSLNVRNGYWFVIDGYDGMRQVVDHLIEKHGCHRFGMVSGSKRSNSATIRLRAFRDSLQAHGIPIREDMIVYGSYFHTSSKIIEQLFDTDPEVEAIVAAQDEMCSSIYRIAKEHGRVVGKDLAVTGYDNIAGSAFMDPPLTTVNADIQKMAQGTVAMVERYLKTGAMESVAISSDPVFRCSCGCSYTQDEESRNVLQDYVNQVFDRQMAVKMVFRDTASALMLRGLVMKSDGFMQFYRQIGDSMHMLSCRASYILIHETPVVIDDDPYAKAPESMRLVMVQKGGNVQAYDLFDAPVIGIGEVPEYVDPDDDLGVRMEFLLFFGSYRYGALCVFADPSESSNYRVLSLQIGSGIRYLIMSLEQLMLSNELEDKNSLLYKQNQALDFLATHDGLTKIYNRTGYLQKVRKMIQDSPDDALFVAMMADVDHLKQINDKLGHAMGDLSIVTTADILAKAVNGTGIVGRSGGDEFMLVYRLHDKKDIQNVRDAIQSGCTRFNETDHLFYLGISMGDVVFNKAEARMLSKVFERADAELYKNKRHRRENVIRG